MNKITMALAGNPNCGKTSLFNTLTGLRHHVGNWPGKTVCIDRNEGKSSFNGYNFDIVDLPGIYSLSSRSLEEEIAAEYLLNEKPDVIVNIVDAEHLERNLYLTLQLIEIGLPVVIALNMNKFAARNGIFVDEKKLSKSLGVPVVKIEAIEKTGKNELLQAAIEHKSPEHIHTYDAEVEEHVHEFTDAGSNRWSALEALMNSREGESHETTEVRKHLEEQYGKSINEILASQKYSLISEIVDGCVSKKSASENKVTQMIDKIVMNRFLAFPIFLVVMFIMFYIVFAVGQPFMDWIEMFFGWLGGIAADALSGAPEWVGSFVGDGIIGGVGGVLVFLPNIVLMFLMIAILENSGYLARIAVAMDSVMKKLGLHGKSFIPMILGFGCSVPGIMAARTLETERSRKLTMLLTPFMSCSARLPVYTLLISAFFEQYQALVLLIVYLLGIVIALTLGIILRRTLFKGEESAFVIEMPEYHFPRIKAVLLSMWDNAKEFLKRAGVIIFPACLLVWLLASLPFGVEYGSLDSVLGIIGSAIAPIFIPLGFGFAEAAISVIMGLLAKEVVVGTFATIYGVAEEGPAIIDAISNVFTPLSAFSFMVFVLLYMPCFATVLTIRKESHSWKFCIFAGMLMIGIAYLVSLIIYQGGLLLGF